VNRVFNVDNSNQLYWLLFWWLLFRFRRQFPDKLNVAVRTFIEPIPVFCATLWAKHRIALLKGYYKIKDLANPAFPPMKEKEGTGYF
jgi:hypothetical protein